MRFPLKLCSLRRYCKNFVIVGWANPMPNWKALCQPSTLLLVFWLPFAQFRTDSKEWLKTMVYFFSKTTRTSKVLYFAPVGLAEVEEATCKNSRDTNFLWNELKCGLNFFLLLMETFKINYSKANKQAISKSIVIWLGWRHGLISFSSLRALRYSSLVLRFRSMYTSGIVCPFRTPWTVYNWQNKAGQHLNVPSACHWGVLSRRSKFCSVLKIRNLSLSSEPKSYAEKLSPRNVNCSSDGIATSFNVVGLFPHPRCLWMLWAKLLYFGSATAHSLVIVAVVSWTIFLGCSLEFAAFSFIFSKTFSCSECFISGSCRCSLVVKTLSSNVVAMDLHCLLSHLHVFNPSFSVKGSTSDLHASVWAFPVDFWQILKSWLIRVVLAVVNIKCISGSIFETNEWCVLYLLSFRTCKLMIIYIRLMQTPLVFVFLVNYFLFSGLTC